METPWFHCRCNVGGIPVTQLIAKERLDEIVDRARVEQRLSAYSRLAVPSMPAAALRTNGGSDCQRRNVYFHVLLTTKNTVLVVTRCAPIVPATVVLKVIEIDLMEEERAAFQNSIDAVKGLVSMMAELV